MVTHTTGLRAVAGAALLSGAAATVAFDFFGQSLSPMAGFPALSPVPLANATIQAVFGSGWGPGAEFLHYAAGVVAYPVGWIVGVEPLSRRVAPGLPWLVAAGAYGVVLWAFALYGMAHLVAGMPAFLGFGAVAWVSLAGHVLFALVAARVARRLLGRSAAPAASVDAGAAPAFA